MVSTIIVAGGNGSRMGGKIPKQFLDIEGEPILVRTLRNFAYLGGEIIVVVPENALDQWKEICSKHKVDVPHKVTTGGADRFGSVLCGIGQVSPEADVILVQDAVRPFASHTLIDRVVGGARAHGAAIPAIGLVDTIITTDGKPVDRSTLLAVQTPQGFSADILRQSYHNAEAESVFTDDASVVRASGHQVQTVEGERENIKITTPFDIKIAKTLW